MATHDLTSAPMRLQLLLSLTIALVIMGCDDESNATVQPPADAGPDVTDCNASVCPSVEDPTVHYLSQDPNACMGTTLDCTPEQNGFQNSCGCGCIDKGGPLCPVAADGCGVTWLSHDPEQCSSDPPECPLGEIGFSNSCGCGCLEPGGE